MTTRTIVTMTALNALITIVGLSRNVPPAIAQPELPMLRGRGLEIVDAQGKVRASISVLPAGTSAAGDAYRETVLLRLITERGRPSVKIGASEESAGLSFAGPTGTKDTYVILEAKNQASSLRLRNEDGREQIVKP